MKSPLRAKIPTTPPEEERRKNTSNCTCIVLGKPPFHTNITGINQKIQKQSGFHEMRHHFRMEPNQNLLMDRRGQLREGKRERGREGENITSFHSKKGDTSKCLNLQGAEGSSAKHHQTASGVSIKEKQHGNYLIIIIVNCKFSFFGITKYKSCI